MLCMLIGSFFLYENFGKFAYKSWKFLMKLIKEQRENKNVKVNMRKKVEYCVKGFLEFIKMEARI